MLITSGGNGSAAGLSLPSDPGDRVLSKYLWVADTSGTTVMIALLKKSTYQGSNGHPAPFCRPPLWRNIA